MQAITYGIKGASLLGSQAEFDNLKRHLLKVGHIAESLGVRFAVFGSPNMRKLNGMDKAEATELAVQRGEEIGRVIGRSGMRLALEPVPAYYGNEFLLSLDDIAAFLQKVKSPFVTTMVDTACMTLHAREDGKAPYDMITRHAALVSHVHLSEPDLRPIGDTGTSRGIGAKPVDHKKFAKRFKKLRAKLRPDMWYVIEMKETPDWRLALTDALSRVKALYEPAVPHQPFPAPLSIKHSRPSIVPMLTDEMRAFPSHVPKDLDFAAVPVDTTSGVATWTVYPECKIPAAQLDVDEALFGGGLVKELHLPATRISYSRDVEIFGRGLVISKSGHLLPETNLRQYVAEDTGGGRAVVQHPPLSVRNDSKETEDPRPVIMLNAVWPVHYGHWLYDNFARLGAIAEFFELPLADLGQHFRICLGYADVKHPWLEDGSPQRYHLQLAGFDDTNIVALPSFDWMRFKDVIVVSSMNNFAPPVPSIFMRPEVKNAFTVVAGSVEQSGCGKRIYVARTDTTNRLMSNEAEIADYLCEHHDFVSIECATLNAEQQVAAFRNAEIIVGPIGNAFMNLAFSNPDAQVIIMAPKETAIFMPYYQGIATAFGNKVTILAGETTKTAANLNHLEWKGDLEALKREIDKMLSRP